MPVIVFSMPYTFDSEPDEEQCSLCGAVTNLLVFVRVRDVLESFCGLCCQELDRGYAEMVRLRMEAKERWSTTSTR